MWQVLSQGNIPAENIVRFASAPSGHTTGDTEIVWIRFPWSVMANTIALGVSLADKGHSHGS